MRVSCQTCQAKYKVADEKVFGRVVKIRCKSCGDTIVIDAARTAPATPTPEGGEVCAPRTGERHEGSVLFSLSALTLAAPKPSRVTPNDASGLVDIRALAQAMSCGDKKPPRADESVAHLGFGGIFAPPLVAPPVSIAFEERREPDKSAAVRLAVSLGALAMVAGVLGAVALARFSAPKQASQVAIAPPLRETATATMPAVNTPPTGGTSMIQSAPPATTATPSRPRAMTTVAVPGAHTASASPSEMRCCPGETDAACEIRRSVGAACVESPPSFDRVVAGRALSAVDLSSCKRADGPRGPGHVKVTFDPSGVASAAEVDTPVFAGTPIARCIAQSYRGVKVPAFVGPVLTVGKSFVL